MTYDVEHLFICSFTICTSSLVMYVIRSLAHFSSGCLLNFKKSLYILGNSPLPAVSFAIISS